MRDVAIGALAALLVLALSACVTAQAACDFHNGHWYCDGEISDNVEGL